MSTVLKVIKQSARSPRALTAVEDGRKDLRLPRGRPYGGLEDFPVEPPQQEDADGQQGGVQGLPGGGGCSGIGHVLVRHSGEFRDTR